VRGLRTSVALAASALLLAACGGRPAASGDTTAKTKAQVGAEKLLKEYEATPGCGCTGAVRAKERAATLFTYAGTGLAAQTR
jgi:ABC-type glycerol-3-phosphate transport system substrate-binding protein